jgi:hypothetical protein
MSKIEELEKIINDYEVFIKDVDTVRYRWEQFNKMKKLIQEIKNEKD